MLAIIAYNEAQGPDFLSYQYHDKLGWSPSYFTGHYLAI